MFGNYERGRNGLYVLSKNDIDVEAENVLRQYCPKCLLKPCEIDIEKLIEDMGLNLCYASMSKRQDILGAFVFNKGIIPIYDGDELSNNYYNSKTIIIDSHLADTNDPRLKFTYGHELGHYVTQYDVFHINDNQLSLFDDNVKRENAIICKRENLECVNFFNEHKKLTTMEDWQEWQANYFSSAILIPRCTLKMALKQYLDNYDVMEQKPPLNILDFDKLEVVIADLCDTYNVSYEMMINRLKSLNYIA